MSTGVQISQGSDSYLLNSTLTGLGKMTPNKYSMLEGKKYKKSKFAPIENFKSPQQINLNLVTAQEAEDFIV